MSTTRPKFSPEIARIAAEEIVGELVKAGHADERERGECVSDLVKHAGPHDDGYEIAKALDDRAHWHCTFAMCEILDGYSYAVSSAIEAAEKAWAAETKPEPPLAIGTRVTFRSERGKITGIYEHGAAKYLVKVDGDKDAKGPTHSRRIVNFEDVQPEKETADARS